MRESAVAEESAQERSLPATQRRLEQAREEGQVARSPELASTLVLGRAGLALWWTGSTMAGRFVDLVGAGLTLDARAAFDPHAMLVRMGALSVDALVTALPLLGTLLVAGVAGPLALGGWNFSTKAFGFDFKRVNPATGLKRMFSAHGAFELAKALFKVILLTAALVGLLWHFREDFAILGAGSVRASLPATGHALLVAFLALVGVMAFLALIDVPFQLWRHYYGLRMSLQEVKEENRESEGDPQIRSRVRARQREMARRRMMSEVPKADVVVTNPTHYSVALKYDEDRMGAPRVVAKGSGLIALRIRELAGANGVPTLEAPPLARALHRHVDIGGEVPAALYGAVAQVLAWVYQLRTPGMVAEAPTAVAVPADLDPGEGKA